jgi:ribosomal protein L40E
MVSNRRPTDRAPNNKEQFMSRSCPACAARLDQQATSCPQCGADLTADPAIQVARTAVVDESARTTAVAAHLSTFAGLIVPFGSVIGPLAVWLTRRDRNPFIDQAGREALNFGITIAIYGSLLLVAALMLVGIPLLVVGVVAWWCWARWRPSRPVRARPTGIR